jgi:hypothetical protein
MILNSYAVLDAFVALLRGLTGILVVVLSLAAWRKSRGPITPESRKALEDRGSLLFLLAFLLLGLNIISWPLLYLLLHSYVPEWPGVMCIYGVTQIGAGSIGPSRFLPELLKVLEITKPALVFAGGAWFVLYLLNRRTANAPLYNRVLAGILCVGVLATTDAAIEGAYLAIPKKEKFLATGCCTEAFDTLDQSSKFLPKALFKVNIRPILYGAYYGINGGLILALWIAARSFGLGEIVGQLVVLGLFLVAAFVALPISAIFLIEIASPTLLHQPYHHCPYDLVPQVPESVLAVALYLWATFCVGWAGVAVWFGRSGETETFSPDMVHRIQMIGCWCYLASLVMMTVEIALA